MSIVAIILTRNKKVFKKTLGFYDDKREINEYDYYLNPNLVANKMEDNKLKDQQVIYFEGNPTPIILVAETKYDEKSKVTSATGKKILWDNSQNILDMEIVNNFTKQMSGVKAPRINKRFALYFILGMIVVSVGLWLFMFGGLKTLGFN